MHASGSPLEGEDKIALRVEIMCDLVASPSPACPAYYVVESEGISWQNSLAEFWASALRAGSVKAQGIQLNVVMFGELDQLQ